MKNLPKITSYYYVVPESNDTETFSDPILEQDFDTLEELFLYAFSHDFKYDELEGTLVKEEKIYIVRADPLIDDNFKMYWGLGNRQAKNWEFKLEVLDKDGKVLGKVETYNEAKGLIQILENLGYTQICIVF